MAANRPFDDDVFDIDEMLPSSDDYSPTGFLSSRQPAGKAGLRERDGSVDGEATASILASQSDDLLDQVAELAQLCAEGSLEEAQEFLRRHGEDFFDYKDATGYTPLHWACLHDQKEVVEWLISLGADILAQGPHEETPFHWAAQGGGLRCLTIILDRLRSLSRHPEDAYEKPYENEQDESGERLGEELIRVPSYFHPADVGGLFPIHYAAQSGSMLLTRKIVSNRC